MKKSYILYIVIILVAIAVAAILVINKKTLTFTDDKPTAVSVTENGLYTNNTYRFSAKLPEGYAAREITDSILFENKSGDGIQIMVTQYDDVKELTADMIRQDIPDIKIEESQPVEIGQNYRGLAFKSDNPAFGGASREVWFVFKGNIYQISTYARLDDILKTMFATWQFF